VLDLTTSIAGPYCTMLLGVLGADVVKVEHPARGDDTRRWGPPFWGGESAAFLALNADKRSLAVDFKTRAGLEIVRRLADDCEVVVQNLRPGLVEQLGLGFEEIRARNPGIIYCSIGAFGKVGPRAGQPGYDPLMQAAGGLMSITGEPERPPVRAGVSVIDQGTGMWATISVLSALRSRELTGGARLIDTSLYETALNWVSYQLVGYLGTREVPGPQGSGLAIIAPYQAFETRDRPVMVAAANERQFRSLCEVLGTPDLVEDDRFLANPDRVEHRDDLARLLAPRFAERFAREWLPLLDDAGVPAALIQDLGEVANDEQTEALDILQALRHPDAEDLQLVAPPLSVNGERLQYTKPSPRLGQHTRAVLEELGYGAEEVAQLLAEGVIRTAQEAARS